MSLPLGAAWAADGSGAGGDKDRAVLLTLLHTNDLHGHTYLPDKHIGLARLAPLIRQICAALPNVVLLDAGDIAHGTPEEKEFAGRPLFTAMNTLPYDAATIGNHEFDFGQKRLRDAMDFARFPYLSANLTDEKTGKPWGGVLPYKMVERGGACIGIFGLTTPTTVGIEWPRTLAGIQFTDPHEAARRMVDHLRTTERADVVICLSHLGYQPDRALAEAVSGMDVILGGHSHTRLAEQVWLNNTLIVQTGCYGAALSRVDLLVQKAQGTQPGRVAVINGRDGHWWGHDGIPAPLGKEFPTGPLLPPSETEDSAIVAAFAPFAAPLRARLAETLTTAEESLPARDALKHETAIGNLLADAVRAQTKTEVAFAASSQIAPTGLAVGPVTVADLYALLPAYTRQHLVTARVPGALLAEVLGRLAAHTASLPAHLSGVVVGPSGITVGDAPLRPDRMYRVAAAAHVIQDYFYNKPGTVIEEDNALAPTVRDAAIAHLRGHAPLRTGVVRRWQGRSLKT